MDVLAKELSQKMPRHPFRIWPRSTEEAYELGDLPGFASNLVDPAEQLPEATSCGLCRSDEDLYITGNFNVALPDAIVLLKSTEVMYFLRI
jgi:hypothetical protein